MDGLEIFRLDTVPRDARIGVESIRDVADDVFNEHGVVVGMLGDGFFIIPFEEREKGTGSRRLRPFDDFLNPDEFLHSDLNGDDGSLVVSAAV